MAFVEADRRVRAAVRDSVTDSLADDSRTLSAEELIKRALAAPSERSK